MSVPFELRTALRYLVAKRKQAFISLISMVSVFGVGVGVMALFITLGLMTGLQSEMRTKILGATAHLSIFRTQGEDFDDVGSAAERVRQVPDVLGAAPAVYTKALLSSPGRSLPITLKGIDPVREQTVTEIARHVEEGSLAALSETGDGLVPALLGHDLASELAVGPGDVVTLTSPQGRLSPLGLLPRVTRLRVVGTVRTGLYEFDAGWIYVPLAAAERLFEAGGRSTRVEVRVRDMYAVREMRRAVLDALGPGYSVMDWIESNGSLFTALWIEKFAIGLTLGLIIMVAALNIVATLVLMVMEKHKDIAILVSMGASRGAIMRIFMLQGTLIGAVGTTVGGVLGYAACRLLDHYRLIRVPIEVYQVAYVPFRLLTPDALAVVAGSLLVCFAATLLPAWWAAKLDPAESLRYE